MKLNSRLTTPIRLLMLSLLLLGSASHVRSQSQCRIVADCQREIALLDQLVTSKNNEIDRLNKLTQQLSEQGKDSDAEIDKQKSLLGEKDKQIGIYQDVNKTMQDSLATQTKIIDNREAAIKDRDAVIKELVKVGKRSAIEKLVDSLPSIAGILALALVK